MNNIEYSVRNILSNWKGWNWDTQNYPLRKEEADVIIEALQKENNKEEDE